VFGLNNKDMRTDLTNQEILDITEKNDKTDIDKYSLVISVSPRARNLTTEQSSKDIADWKDLEWRMFCDNVRLSIKFHGL
jgi:hypothetical protein